MEFDDIDLAIGSGETPLFNANTAFSCQGNPTTFTQSCTCATCTLGGCIRPGC